MSQTPLKPETLALHAGWRADPTTGAVAVPIYQTTSYQFQSTEHAANLFALKELGNIYTRIMNPTNDVLEKRVAALEGGVARAGAWRRDRRLRPSRCRTSPAPATTSSRSTDLYGGTWNLFANTLKDQGIEVRFVDPVDPRQFPPRHRRPHPRLLCRDAAEPEADGVPHRRSGGDRPAVRHPADHGQHRGADPTRPFDHGAAVVVYSSTKYLGGHGTSIGGLIVDGGNFPWERIAERQPALNTPDPSYHGAVWTEAVKPLGPIAYIIKARVTLLRDLGAAMSPFNAFLTLQGIETLPLRIERHSANAAAVAAIARQAAGSGEGDPSLAAERRARASAREKYLKGGYGGLVGFELEGGQGGGPALHRRAAALLSRRQHRRRAHARHPSRRRPPTRSSRPRTNSPPASRKGTCACRSASSTSTTSSPTSTAALSAAGTRGGRGGVRRSRR